MDNGTTTIYESFSIEFGGKAFDQCKVPAAALAQSLLALDGLARKSCEAVYGSDCQTEVEIQADSSQGSFIVDLSIECDEEDPLINGGSTAVRMILGVINLGKWAYGKKVKVIEDDPFVVYVQIENDKGEVSYFGRVLVNLYNLTSTQSQLSRLTQTLEIEGADTIKIVSLDEPSELETITKEERQFFRQEEGIVLTDNETDVILEVIGPMLNGSPKGWRFSEGEGGLEFTASVEDDEFLRKIIRRELSLVSGMSIRASVRTVQRKTVRTTTERTITEVKEIFLPDAK
ncbi:MAG: hypothetical protein Q4E62_09705 [Sutterellaceae bacterium]|nr:hypothetical protein [Sutterellaceae bacterium]